MTTLRESAQAALEALDTVHPGSVQAEALREALAAEPQEPPMRETDLYEFAGWLTQRPGTLVAGTSHEAGPMAEVVGEFIRTHPNRFEPVAPQEPAPQEWEHLKRFGYAPGNYMNKCCRCEQVVVDVDKRATCCLPCAEKLHAALHQEPAPQPVAWLYCGGIFGNELQDWEIEAEQSKCDAINEAQFAAGREAKIPLYVAAPPPRQPLTDERIDSIPFHGFTDASARGMSEAEAIRDFARAIEAALGIKP